MMRKSLSEMTIEELWELFPIQLTEYKEYWNDWYREEQEFLAFFLPKNVRIYDIGSTSINGIWAKPIVDILVEAPPKEHQRKSQSKSCQVRIMEMCYQPVPELKYL